MSTHRGLGHTDLHLLDGVPGLSAFPMVAGHEIVGLVAARGDRERDVEIGPRVGAAAQAGVCRERHRCRAGDDVIGVCGAAPW